MYTENTSRLSPNFSPRALPISAIIIHGTACNLEIALNTLTDPRPDDPNSRVSSHVVIAKDGTIYRLVWDDQSAWHAGVSSLFGQSYHNSCNHFSLGIELENENGEDYPDEQFLACVNWIHDKVLAYSINLNRIVSHAEIAPGRKIDAINWPWNKFFSSFVASFGGIMMFPTPTITTKAIPIGVEPCFEYRR